MNSAAPFSSRGQDLSLVRCVTSIAWISEQQGVQESYPLWGGLAAPVALPRADQWTCTADPEWAGLPRARAPGHQGPAGRCRGTGKCEELRRAWAHLELVSSRAHSPTGLHCFCKVRPALGAASGPRYPAHRQPAARGTPRLPHPSRREAGGEPKEECSIQMESQFGCGRNMCIQHPR